MRRVLATAAAAALMLLAAGCTASPPMPNAESMSSAEMSRVEAVEPTASFEELDEAGGILVEWSASEPGTLTVSSSGSGSIDCVPEPMAAYPESGMIVLEFTPISPDVLCTADLRLYAWNVSVSGTVDTARTTTALITGLDPSGDLRTQIAPEGS